MKLHVVLPLFLILLAACGSEEKKSESAEEAQVALESVDTIPLDTGHTVVIDSSSIELVIDPSLSLEEKSKLFSEKYEGLYEKRDNRNNHIMDRFDKVYGEKYDLKKKTQVAYGEENMLYPVASLSFYRYEDTLKFNNAITNWFSCFESDCNEVKPGETIDAVKSPPAFGIINPSEMEIIYLFYPCEHASNNWDEFKKDLKNAFARKGHYLFDLECGGPLTWQGTIEQDGE